MSLTFRQKSRVKRSLFVIAGVLAVTLAVGQIKIDPPSELQGGLHVSGKITNCEFDQMLRPSSIFFVGVSLDTAGSPYLRANPKHRERAFYESLCQGRANVNVRYRAVRRLMGPIRYWISDIAPIQ